MVLWEKLWLYRKNYGTMEKNYGAMEKLWNFDIYQNIEVFEQIYSSRT